MEQDIGAEIKKALQNFQSLARYDVRYVFKHLSRDKKYEAARNLLKLSAVADNPELYFARKNTEAAWYFRGEKFAAKHRLTEQEARRGAYYIVQTPADLVSEIMDSLPVTIQLKSKFYHFCNLVLNWEYDHTSDDSKICENSELYVPRILDTAQQTSNAVRMNMMHPLTRPFAVIAQRFQRTK